MEEGPAWFFSTHLFCPSAFTLLSRICLPSAPLP